MPLTTLIPAARSARRLYVIVLAVVLAASAAASAGANSPRSTKGDAQAVLNAFGNGGWAVLQHSPKAIGAPAAGLAGSATTIRPFSEFFDGLHYCVLDWHVAVIAYIEGGDSSFTGQNARALLGPIVNTFWIDGVTVPTERTPVKRFNRDLSAFGITEAYYFQEGRILSPADLPVGAHTLRVRSSDSSGVFFDEQVTFHIDAAGTGTCL